MSKRSREGTDLDQEEIMEDDTRTANLLLLLSTNPTVPSPPPAPTSSAKRLCFECKTCSRRFRTFQALGGHCTSHNREGRRSAGREVLAKVHECSVCGLRFEMGQALGGHMRRHRTNINAMKDEGMIRKELWLDLDLQINSTCMNKDEYLGRSHNSAGQLLNLFI